MSILRKHHKHKPRDHNDESDDHEFEELQNCHSGWLTKKSILKSKQVWCTLNGRWLSFWKDESEPQQHPGTNRNAEAIDLCMAQQVMRAIGTKTPFGFDIVVGKDRTTLLASNMKECDQWIQNLQMAMQFKIRAASLRQSSRLRQSQEMSTPLTESPPNPLYEEVFDPPVAVKASTPTTSQPQTPVAVPLPSERNHLELPAVDAETPEPPTTAPTAASRPTTLPTTALYEEVDLKSPAVSPPTQGRPQPAVRKSLQEKTSPPVPQARPMPRPSIKKSALPAPNLMPILDECDDDAEEQKKEMDDEVNNDAETKVVMRASVSTMNADQSLPTVTDLYAVVCKKENLEHQTTAKKVESIWGGLEESKPAHLHSKHELESQAIAELRALLGVPAPLMVTSSKEKVEHTKLERGQHMQELHNLLYQ